MSKKFETVKNYYKLGLWTAQMVHNAVGKWITQGEADAIISMNGGEVGE